MKKDLHPDYQECIIECVCGNKVKTRGTKKSLKIEICSDCHPFYTGKSKLVDTAGRVDRFMKRFEKSKEIQEKRKQTIKATKSKKDSKAKTNKKSKTKKVVKKTKKGA